MPSPLSAGEDSQDLTHEPSGQVATDAQSPVEHGEEGTTVISGPWAMGKPPAQSALKGQSKASICFLKVFSS